MQDQMKNQMKNQMFKRLIDSDSFLCIFSSRLYRSNNSRVFYRAWYVFGIRIAEFDIYVP